ncbi:MAG: hypothetical protein MK102_10165 [Fuerstiella sp.]|nr:hypothetical protein [Fuerstiella sp.]
MNRTDIVGRFCCCLTVLIAAIGDTIAADDDESESRTVRVAAISFVPKKFDLAGNARRLEAAFRQAGQGGAQIAVAPEGVLEGYVVNEIIAGEVDEQRMNDVAVPLDHPVIERFRDLARELKMCLVFGLAERIEDDVYNCAVFIDHFGDISGKYHKMQLAEGYHSSWWFNRLGSRSRAFDTPFGRCGLMICNDRWNPQLARIPVLDGAQFLIIPSMGSRSKAQDEAVLSRGRENGVPVVEANVGVTLVVNDNQITSVDRKDEVITFGEITIASAVRQSPADRDRVEQEFLTWRNQEMRHRLHRQHRRNRSKAGVKSDNPFIRSQTQVIAFAGGPGPENTIAAVKQSLRLEVPILEFDVRLSKDCVPVLMHDADLSRTTDGTGHIADLTYAELRQLDAGSKYVDQATGVPLFAGERIPALKELLSTIEDTRTILLDVKVPEAVPLVAEIIRQMQAYEGVVFRVNSAEEIERLREIDTGLQCVLRTAISKQETGPLLDRLTQLRVVGCTPESWQELTPTLVGRFHHAGIALLVVGADQPDDIRQLIDAGVDGLFTESPAQLQSIIRNSE